MVTSPNPFNGATQLTIYPNGTTVITYQTGREQRLNTDSLASHPNAPEGFVQAARNPTGGIQRIDNSDFIGP